MDRMIELKAAAEQAQASANELRDVFNAEIRRVHSEGSTLRELSKALGISFQRVHQIVGGQNVVQCSFCGRPQEDVPKLIAGPNCYICTACVGDAFQVLESGAKKAGFVQTLSKQLSDVAACSFCRKKASEGRVLAAGPGAQICNRCVDLCREIIADDDSCGDI